MQNIILKVIADIEAEKRAAAVAPRHAMVLEVTNRLHTKALQELEIMQATGVVRLGHTLNDRYISVNRQPTNASKTLFKSV